MVGGFPRRAQSWPLRCRLARSCAGPAAEPRVPESPKPAAGEPGALRGAQTPRTESRGRGQLAARDPGPPPPPLQRKAQQLSEATGGWQLGAGPGQLRPVVPGGDPEPFGWVGRCAEYRLKPAGLGG